MGVHDRPFPLPVPAMRANLRCRLNCLCAKRTHFCWPGFTHWKMESSSSNLSHTIASRKEINHRPKKVRQRNHQNPGDFFVAADIFVLDAINQHPDPEGGGQEAKGNEENGEQEQQNFPAAEIK